MPAHEFAPRDGVARIATVVGDARARIDRFGRHLAMVRGDPEISARPLLRRRHHRVVVAVGHPDRDLAEAIRPAPPGAGTRAGHRRDRAEHVTHLATERVAHYPAVAHADGEDTS